MSNVKKIMMVANNATGLFLFRKHLIERLQDLGVEVTALIPKGINCNELKKIGVHIVEIPMDRRGMNPLNDLKLLFQYLITIKRISPELVITYTIKPNIYAGIVARFLKKDYVANITGLGTAFESTGILNHLVKIMYKFALKNAKCVFFENSSDKDIFVNTRIITPDCVKVLHGAGVDLSQFKYCEYPDNDKFSFLFIGRIMQEKGIDELFAAFKRLINEHKNCELHILGSCEEDYEQQIRVYGDEGWLFYHGFQKDIRPFILACDCFVLPSYHEGMANTNLECAASGRPIITSNIPGCREAVINNVSGMLCEPKSTDSLYQTMNKMMEKSKTERELMGKNGRKHMEEVFDKEKVVDETIACLMI